jgi:hypothetical protein
MTISKKLIKQMNEYYGTEYIKDDSKPTEADKPGTRCIANGNTWKKSEVKDD